MKQIIYTKGLPSSGKTTFSKQWVNEAPKERIRVNRDDIRRMLGPYWIPTREDLVTTIEQEMVRSSLREGYSVIVDATNFKDDWIIKLHKMSTNHNPDIELVMKDFTNVSLEECILRDKLRSKEEQVGEEVIKNMALKYLKPKI